MTGHDTIKRDVKSAHTGTWRQLRSASGGPGVVTDSVRSLGLAPILGVSVRMAGITTSVPVQSGHHLS